MKRKKKKKKRNCHHIIPVSRSGGSGDNITLICQDCHNLYHQQFQNMKPDEIIKYLVEYFWNGQWKWVVKALKHEEV
jgi:hypothetical protein|tara:strand:+ start:1129 stop:1359 length:231 start_codon:yes stop_codon:yes gene_type:complete